MNANPSQGGESILGYQNMDRFLKKKRLRSRSLTHASSSERSSSSVAAKMAQVNSETPQPELADTASLTPHCQNDAGPEDYTGVAAAVTLHLKSMIQEAVEAACKRICGKYESK